ncbi:alkylphosphonate utilization protein [Phaeobacter sp. J2-8]|uniref:alkylphosphonate utilization protein n=1 Tax=Phaeobacter sp. J2-8 TaxID=2931394 RepID=UPI001FD4230F|nr:alkylphosphonate utilization protein [Phaeobacter sp. J2-8]MCJ7873130.1 alkylphosphonate utilization protein [Phaeobacter sp. J2-8]
MVCELCDAPEAVAVGEVQLCTTCAAGLAGDVSDDPHWQCLHGAVWAERPEVQLAAARILVKLEAPWAQEVLAMGALPEAVLAEAEGGAVPQVLHRDTNGVVLAAGDTVVLIKDLPVKGAGFTAKRGTAVRGISLVAENAGHIEGRVDGQRIVILTEFVKRQG